MAHRVDGSSGGGYPDFKDTGGPVGSDNSGLVAGENKRRLEVAMREAATYVPLSVEGELFDRSVGTTELSHQTARLATQTCVHGLTQAPSRFYEGHLTLGGIVEEARSLARSSIEANEKAYGSNSECKKSCILAFLGKCPLAMLDFDISEPAFAELVGIQIRSKKPPKRDPAGVSTFKFFSARSFSVRPPGFELSTEEVIEENSAAKHITSWWAKHRPRQKQTTKTTSTAQQHALQF